MKVTGKKPLSFKWVKWRSRKSSTLIRWAVRLKGPLFGNLKTCKVCKEEAPNWSHLLNCAYSKIILE